MHLGVIENHIANKTAVLRQELALYANPVFLIHSQLSILSTCY